MSKIIKATAAEKDDYRINGYGPGKPGLYPLFGFIKVDGRMCPIELLNEPDNKYEVMAPIGFHFGGGENVHSLLCVDQADIEVRTGCVPLDQCKPGCGCGCELDEAAA